MKREIITTADGSKTIHIPEWNEQYHSKHGAIQEAYHVFIKHGLSLFKDRSVKILEIGFGTGLNALITCLEAEKLNVSIQYKGVEAFPITEEELSSLNYVSQLNAEDYATVFDSLHAVEWETAHKIKDFFSLTKQQKDFREIEDTNAFDLIYFDAFGARVQPELWTEAVFERMFLALKEDSYLVTYSAKGSVRRAMQAVGFLVERLPGPPGKREMLRAYKGRL